MYVRGRVGIGIMVVLMASGGCEHTARKGSITTKSPASDQPGYITRELNSLFRSTKYLLSGTKYKRRFSYKG